jgi:hypothetical protein
MPALEPIGPPPGSVTAAIPMQGYVQYPGPPTYDPMAMAQQYSGPPVSGPYSYGMPMMASGIPAPMPEKRRGRAGTVVLAVLTTLFLLATGVMTTLFIAQMRETDKLSSQVTELSGETADQKSRIDTLQRDLDTTRRDLTDSRGETDEITLQKNALAGCLTALDEFFIEADRSGANSTATQRKADAVDEKCTEADKYR